MPVDLDRRLASTPLPTFVLIVPDEFLLFRIHRDDGFPLLHGLAHPRVDMPKLRVTIGMVIAFLGLTVALQTDFPQALLAFPTWYNT